MRFAPALLLIGCLDRPGDDLARVLPDERLLINLPSDGGAKGEREWSEYYLLTAKVTGDVNGLTWTVLAWVDAITDYPAVWADESKTRAIWGPWYDTLDPVETILYVEERADGGYDWAFQQKPRGGADSEYVTVIAGEVDPGADDTASSGRYTLDFTAIHELNPTEPATGAFAVEYDVDEVGVSAVASLEGFADGGEPFDAIYAYAQEHGGGGQMDLGWSADLDSGGAEELYAVRSRWLADGQGRSDAQLTGGDLGGLTALESECWSNSFEAVYSANNYEPASDGDEALCAFAEESYAGE